MEAALSSDSTIPALILPQLTHTTSTAGKEHTEKSLQTGGAANSNLKSIQMDTMTSANPLLLLNTHRTLQGSRADC